MIRTALFRSHSNRPLCKKENPMCLTQRAPVPRFLASLARVAVSCGLCLGLLTEPGTVSSVRATPPPDKAPAAKAPAAKAPTGSPAAKAPAAKAKGKGKGKKGQGGTAAELTQMLMAKGSLVQDCAVTGALDQGSGRVEISTKVTINGRGQVINITTNVKVDKGEGGPKVRECVDNLIRSIPFPSSSAPLITIERTWTIAST